MKPMTVSALVAAPPEFVFDRAIDVLRWPERISGVKAIELLTPGPVRVGTRFRETREMFGRLATEEMEFTAIELPRSFTLEAHSHGMHYISRRRCDPDGSGTRLALEFSGRAERLLARLMMPLGWLMVGAVRKVLEQDAADLKAAVEQAYAAASGGAGADGP
jgi:hypothetical protein